MAGAAQKRMQQRRGTSATWASLDPVLLAGEFGVATDTGAVKVGDGVKKWSALEAVSSDPFVFESEGDEGGGGIPMPPNDGKYYLIKDGEWAAVDVIVTPAAFAPVISDGQELTLSADQDMTPYIIQSENTGGA